MIWYHNQVTTKPIPINQDEINSILWKACDTFRGTIDPSEYKNYILVMLFLKYISDVWQDRYTQLQAKYGDNESRIRRQLQYERFILPPGANFNSLYQQRQADNIGQLINNALEAIALANRQKLENVFRNVDFNSEAALGRTKQRNGRLKNLLQDFHDPRLDMRPSRIGHLDIIGNAYEYLIGQFASGAGKKAGEFYTPPEVSQLLAQLLDPQPGDRIADPACGSGSLLIKCAQQAARNHLPGSSELPGKFSELPGKYEHNYALYGMEANGATWALCLMNMFLHNINVTTDHIKWTDTLREPTLTESNNQLMRFNVVVANPPFSLDKWGAENAAADRFNRFHRGLPPKSKGDYAFLSHMIETTYLEPAQNGRIGVVVPHGVLLRGGAEGKIRKQFIQENLLDAVIGLPANLFYGTSIPAAILIFKRHRPDQKVLFIDASRHFEPGSTQNRLSHHHRQRILNAYQQRTFQDKYAYLADHAEIHHNDYNLNIPRYVDTFEEEELVDMTAVNAEIADLRAKLAETEVKMTAYLQELDLNE